MIKIINDFKYCFFVFKLFFLTKDKEILNNTLTLETRQGILMCIIGTVSYLFICLLDRLLFKKYCPTFIKLFIIKIIDILIIFIIFIIIILIFFYIYKIFKKESKN